jgi:hypothetical protein
MGRFIHARLRTVWLLLLLLLLLLYSFVGVLLYINSIF